MIKWYSNKYVEIYFDEIPHVGIRYLLPSSTEEEKVSIKKYPFMNKRNLKVRLVDKQKGRTFDFEIPKGYCYDGASVPRLFWRVIGPNTDNSFLIPALIHDVLCEHHEYVDYDRKFSTIVFNALLESTGVPPFKRYCMKTSVDVFQKIFCNWGVNVMSSNRSYEPNDFESGVNVMDINKNSKSNDFQPGVNVMNLIRNDKTECKIRKDC